MTENNIIYLEFEIKGERITRTDNNRIASGTRNYIRARFLPAGDWVGINPIAIFTKGIISIQVLTQNGECSVPNEMTAREGHFTVCVYGGSLKTTTTEKAHIAVVKSGYTSDEDIILGGGGDILSFVKSLDKRIQFIREAGDGAFEYSLDGAVWHKVDSAWFPSVSPDGLLTWERRIAWEPPESVNIKGDKGDTGSQGDKGDKGEQGDRGLTGLRGEKGEEGKQGIQGQTGIQGPPGTPGAMGPSGGVTAPIAGFFTMYVDSDSNLWVVTHKGGVNPFVYDDDTGNLYYIVPKAA